MPVSHRIVDRIFQEGNAMPNSLSKIVPQAVLLAAVCSGSVLIPYTLTAAHAQEGAPVRITVITDLDEDLYNARSGAGGVDATRMAVADFGGSVLGRPIIVDSRNDHNKPDDVAALANDAYDKGADLLMDIQNSPIATAVSKVAAQRHRLAIVTLAATPALTRAACNKYTYHYSFDAAAIASATATSVAKLPDGKRWVAIVADAGFGRSAVAAFQPSITAQGGELLKSFLVPVGTTDLTAILQEAQALNPDVIAVFSAGADADRKVAQVTKFAAKAHVTTALLYLSDVDRVKDGYAGVRATVPWYWNLDATARAWSDRFAAAHGGLRPTAAQAADYSATTQWLQAVKAVGTTDADIVSKYLDGRNFDDMFARHAQWRAGDHAVVHDLYVVDVLPSTEIAEPHAWFRVVETIPAQQAFPVDAANPCKM
jgi:branched-chain amino acid transport system substrate-binding protein